MSVLTQHWLAHSGYPAEEVASMEPIRTAAAHVPYAVQPLSYININYLKGNI